MLAANQIFSFKFLLAIYMVQQFYFVVLHSIMPLISCRTRSSTIPSYYSPKQISSVSRQSISSVSRNLLVGSVLAIQRITCGTAHQVKAIVDASAISPLIALLASTDTDVLHSAIVTLLANIVLCGSELRDRIISEGLVAPLVGLIKPNIPVNQD